MGQPVLITRTEIYVHLGEQSTVYGRTPGVEDRLKNQTYDGQSDPTGVSYDT